MAKKMISGNEAVAYAALAAGVKVVAGYPGTPSSEVIDSLLKKGDFPGTAIEWSTNEKVAVEVAAGAAWLGKRALCTMKMSGLNVAYDSLSGIAYSGCTGGMVVYVCDDPGVTTGMVEQDVRGFAMMSDMVMLEPANVQESYDLIKYAFELSEAIGYPVFVRSVTNVAQSRAAIEVEPRVLPSSDPVAFNKDITKYTKAGPIICMGQHQRIIAGLAQAAEIIQQKALNELDLKAPGGIGLITAGVTNSYIDEALTIARQYGFKDEISTLKLRACIPYPVEELQGLLKHCSTIIVAEQNETYIEKELFVQAYKLKADAEIIGKLDGTLSRIGAFNALTIAKAICKGQGITIPETVLTHGQEAKAMCAKRPITTCAGCPHRGTFMAINQAVKNLKYKKDEVMVTGDVGCTILGMNPPFETVSTEISMGASIPLAQGMAYAGFDKPIIATIGDSTFFHAGVPGLINALQHNINMTVVLMDNGWTGMTGMQTNPNTAQEFQPTGCQNVDLVEVVRGIGIEPVIVDPFDLPATIKAVEAAIKHPGLSAVVARRECAMPTNRRKIKYNEIDLQTDKCTNCKACISITGCPAISLHQGKIEIDPKTCNGCGLCITTCKFGALSKTPINK